MNKMGLFVFFYYYCSCVPSDKFVIPCLFLRNTENAYGWVQYHIWPLASCDTATIHRYLSVLGEQTGDNSSLEIRSQEPGASLL